MRFTAAAIRACVDLSHRHVNDRFLPDKAIDVLDETGAAVRLRPGQASARRSACATSRRSWRAWRTSPRCARRSPTASGSRTSRRSCARWCSARTPRSATVVRAVKRGRAGLSGRRAPDRLLPVHGPDRRRQDRALQAAREGARRAVRALRHERVHGEARGVAADRRAARLRRLRPGRPARRADPQGALHRAPARRDREGAPGSVRRSCSR